MKGTERKKRSCEQKILVETSPPTILDGPYPDAVRYIPVRTVERVLEEAVQRGQPHALRLLLEEMIDDRRFCLRLRVAECIQKATHQLLEEGFDPLESLLSRLAQDPIPIVQQAAAEALRVTLKNSSMLFSIWIVGTWATSSNPQLRQAVAGALCDQTTFVGDTMAVEVLSEDSVASIRTTAVKAASIRLLQNPARYLKIMFRLCTDNRHSVRMAALDGLEKAAREGVLKSPPLELGRLAVSPDEQTAEKAIQILAVIGRRTPTKALAVFEDIKFLFGDVEISTLGHMLGVLGDLGPSDPRRCKRILSKLSRHNEPWVRHEAQAVMSSITKPHRPTV